MTTKEIFFKKLLRIFFCSQPEEGIFEEVNLYEPKKSVLKKNLPLFLSAKQKQDLDQYLSLFGTTAQAEDKVAIMRRNRYCWNLC